MASISTTEKLAIVAGELSFVQDELENRAALANLRTALTSGRPSGSVGSLDTTTVSTTVLADALALVNRMGVKTDLARQLLASAEMVMQVRTALLKGEWDELELLFDEVGKREVLAATEGKDAWAAAEARHELRLVENEVRLSNDDYARTSSTTHTLLPPSPSLSRCTTVPMCTT